MNEGVREDFYHDANSNFYTARDVTGGHKHKLVLQVQTSVLTRRGIAPSYTSRNHFMWERYKGPGTDSAGWKGQGIKVDELCHPPF